MGATTEVEIFGVLAENLRVAAEICGTLAWNPKRGPLYRKFLAAIKDAAGAATQAFYWRDYDSRWLYIAENMRQVGEMTGRWMRDSASKEARKEAHPMFVKLGQTLASLSVTAEVTKTAATGKLGPIVPPVRELPEIRSGRPVQVMTPGGILLP